MTVVISAQRRSLARSNTPSCCVRVCSQRPVPLLFCHWTSSDREHVQPSYAEPNIVQDQLVRSRRCPASCYLDPLSKATPFFAFDITNVSVTATPAAHAVLLRRIREGPVLVLFLSLLLFLCRLLEERYARQLPCWSIGRTMLDRGMAVTDVTEVVDVSWCKERPSSQRMNGSITPLESC